MEKSPRLAGIFFLSASVLVASSIYMLIPIYGQVAGTLSASSVQVSLAGSIFTICYAAGLLVFGPVSDYAGRKNVIAAGLGFSALFTLLAGLSHTLAGLYMMRGLQGLALASFAPVAFSCCYEIFPERKRIFIISGINAGFLVAGAAGQTASSFVSGMFGWQAVFYLFSGLYALLFVFALLALKGGSRLAAEPWADTVRLMAAFLNKTVFLYLYGIAFTMLAAFIIFYDVLNRQAGLAQGSIQWIRMLGLAGTSSALAAGWVIRRWGMKVTWNASLAAGSAGLLLVLATESLAAMGLSAFLFSGAVSLLIPSIITLIGNAAGKKRTKALSLYSFILLSGASIAPPLAALLTFRFSIVSLLLVLAADYYLFSAACKYIKYDIQAS